MRQESLFPSLECLGPSRVSRSSRPSQSATRVSEQNAGPPHNRVSYSTATSLSHCLDTEAISHLRRLSCSPDPPSAYISALSLSLLLLLYFSLEDMLGHKQSREGCNEYKYCRGLHTVLVGIPDLPDHPSHDEDNEIDGHTIH